MPSRLRIPSRWAACLLAAALLAGCGSAAAPTSGSPSQSSSSAAAGGKVQLLETGSTLLYPLFNIWVPAYQKNNPNVQITTQGTGSGTGIAEASKGTAQIGASDAYMSDSQVKGTPGIENIPLAISAQQINYNIPGLNSQHLHLSGPVLARIYEGKVTKWNAPAIAQLNPGVKLPNQTIIPVHRTDGSGDTFIFTQYLSFSDPSGWGKAVGYGTSVNFPAVPGGLGAEGNPGMVQALKGTPYSIAYVGISFLDQTDQAGLGYAALLNRAGSYVLPTASTISAAAASVASRTPADERISIVFTPGANAYPIVNYEYAIVSTKQSNTATATALKAFLSWCVNASDGNAASFLDQVHFIGLPPAIAQLSQAQISKIGS
jgi:phosphate transport system substrate-binding protein